MTRQIGRTAAGRGSRRRLMALCDYRRAGEVEAALGERWEVERVNSAEEVLWKLRRAPFDALLLAIDTSREAGEELFADVYRAHPDLPIVLIVEPGQEIRAAWALGRGAAGYIPVGGALALLAEPVLENAVHGARQRRMHSRSLELEHRDQLRLLAQTLRHEINNPLTGILGHAEIGLRSPGLPAVIERRLSKIVQLTEQIREIVQELETVHDGHSRLVSD